jgi:hypothetical protein
VIQRATPIAHQLTFMLLTTAAALMLGLEAFFGAFVAGIVVAATESKPSQATLAIRSFSLAFFIPVYFAGIGLGLDLIHGFDVVFFVGFVLAACLIKATRVYLGARAACEDCFSSLNLAIAMNAARAGYRRRPTGVIAGIIDHTLRGAGATRHHHLPGRGRLAGARRATGCSPGARVDRRSSGSVEGDTVT